MMISPAAEASQDIPGLFLLTDGGIPSLVIMQ